MADQISYRDPTLEEVIVRGPLQFLLSSWYEPGIQSKTSSWLAVNLKARDGDDLQHLSPRYGRVILVSGYFVFTGVNIDHNMDVEHRRRAL